MGRTKVFLRNAATAAILQAVTMIAGFVLPRVMLGVYGSEVNGLIVSLTQFVSFFTLVEMGISTSVIYALYEPIAQQDVKKINGILVAARDFYRQAGYIFLFLTLGLVLVYPLFITTTALSRFEVRMLILVLGVSSVIEFFVLAKYRVFLIADQKMYVLSLATIASMLCNVLAFAGMAWAGFSVVSAKIVSLLSVFTKVGIIWQYCHSHYSFLTSDEAPINSALSRRWDAFYLQILEMLQDAAPVLLATLLTDLKTVSIFSIYSLVTYGLRGILKIGSSGISAIFGDIIVRKEMETLKQSFGDFEFLYCLLCAGMYGTALVLIVPFVMIYTQGINDADYNQPYLGGLLLLSGFLSVLKNPQGILVVSAGMFKETRWQSTAQGMIEVVGGLLLGWQWGIDGILCGMILSNFYRVIDLPIFISRHVVGISALKSFRRYGYAVMVVGILSVLILFISVTPQNFEGWIVALLKVILYASIATGTIGFCFEPQTCKSIVARICGVWRQ